MDKENQFYPTPRSLGLRAAGKFQNRRVTRLLDPSAGRGDLIDAAREAFKYRFGGTLPVDCIEIDFDNQAVLRSKGLRVVGTDFLQYRGASLYSHILMNPPFAEGAKHTLQAWELLFSGELVSIVNAETIRNPFSQERKQLVALIEACGSCEFVQEAFESPDTKRKTSVEVAIVHLKKTANLKTNFLDQLKKDDRPDSDDLVEAPNELILPQNKIQNLVTAFNAAVKAAREAELYEARSAYYAGMLGKSILDEKRDDQSEDGYCPSIAERFNSRYDKLKESAWSSILRSTDVMSKLSTAARKRLESQFDQIVQLEFSESNIYGFLCGLVHQQGDIQIEMLCDVFDLISKHHPENRAQYQGWKSNAKHRVNAYRIMMSRFILPIEDAGYIRGYGAIDWRAREMLSDIDKVFAMLDGKTLDQVQTMEKTILANIEALKNGERISSQYFDLRIYFGKSTVHFFPRDKKLIERMNRLVGKHRAWLPDNEHSGEDNGFWQQYEKAETINKRMDLGDVNEWRLMHGSEIEQAREADKVLKAHMAALEELGIAFDPDKALQAVDREQLALPLSA